MTGFDAERYTEDQRKDWNNVASAWEKWDKWLESSMTALDRRLIESAKVAHGQAVLDIGSGTGNPAISIAEKVGINGHVTGLDQSEGMLGAAIRKSGHLNLKNVTFKVCDVKSIPFEDASFDAVTSRFCLMFLPYLKRTLSEIYRVLKDGGRVSASVWGTGEKNPILSLPFDILKQYIEIPKPEPDQPGIFSLSQPGDLMKQMEKAGFKYIEEEVFPVEWTYSSGQEYVEVLFDLAAPIRSLLAKLPLVVHKEVKDKIAEAAEGYGKDGKISLPGEALIISAQKS